MKKILDIKPKCFKGMHKYIPIIKKVTSAGFKPATS